MVLKKLEEIFHPFVYKAFTLYGTPFQMFSTRMKYISPSCLLPAQLTLTTLILHEQQSTSSHPRSSQRDSQFRSLLHNMSLDCSLFARHYWGNKLLFFFPADTERFHFSACPPIQLCIHCKATGFKSSQVTPFGNPRIIARLAATRGLSQPTTSFISLLRQGIHRMPLICFILKLLSYSVLNVQLQT